MTQPESGIREPPWPPHVARRGRPRTVALDLVKDPRGEVTLRNTVQLITIASAQRFQKLVARVFEAATPIYSQDAIRVGLPMIAGI